MGGRWVVEGEASTLGEERMLSSFKARQRGFGQREEGSCQEWGLLVRDEMKLLCGCCCGG